MIRLNPVTHDSSPTTEASSATPSELKAFDLFKELDRISKTNKTEIGPVERALEEQNRVNNATSTSELRIWMAEKQLTKSVALLESKYKQINEK